MVRGGGFEPLGSNFADYSNEPDVIDISKLKTVDE
jgi:hypothetical protein